jgi:hypothetical protein
MRGPIHSAMLVVFLGLVVSLLSLIAVPFRFGRHAGILKKLPLVVIAMSALVIPSRVPAQIATPDQSSPAALLPTEPPETVAPAAPAPESHFERPVSWKRLIAAMPTCAAPR